MSSTKTVYTATISLPMYAAWRCPKCNKINFSTGTIICQRQAQASTSLLGLSQEEAEKRAMDSAKQEWADDALAIMLSPRQHTTEVHENLKMGNAVCAGCGQKPKWSRGVGNWTIVMIGASLIGFISGIVAIGIKNSIIAWSIFAVCIGVISAGIIKGIRYRTMIKKLPNEFTPVFGTINSELVDYARNRGESIPTPEEAVEIVIKNEKNIEPENPITPIEDVTENPDNKRPDEEMKKTLIVENSESENKAPATIRYCKHCGQKLLENSIYCSYCGEKVI